MAMVFMDGMDLYGADATGGDSDLTEAGWTLSDAAQVAVQATGRFGGHAVRCGAGDYIERTTLLVGDTIIVQSAIKLDTPQLGSGEIFRCKNNGGADSCFSLHAINGAIQLRDSDDVIVLTTAPFLRLDVWHYLEAHAVIGDERAVEVKLDGVTVIDAAQVKTDQNDAETVDRVRFVGGFAGASWDDVVILDGSGTRLNALLGDRRITVLSPDADTADEDWTRSAGADSFALVDDPVPGDHDGDATYIERELIPGLTMVSIADLDRAPVVECVATALSARQTEAGTVNPTTRIRNERNDLDGGAVAMTESYQTFRDFFELDPDGNGWLLDTVNAAEIGIVDVTSPDNMIADTDNMIADTDNMVAG